MALTAHGNWSTRDVGDRRSQAMVVLDGSSIYSTALCSHDTASGEIKPFDGTQTDRLVGWALGANDPLTGGPIAGNAAAPRNTAPISDDFVALVPVATLADDATDYGKPVYATDDNTYTITDPTSGQIVGRVEADDNRVAGQAWVHFFIPQPGA